MFAGEHINTSEDRAVLHTALRLPVDKGGTVDSQDVVADMHEVLDKMGAFTDRLRSGEWKIATGGDQDRRQHRHRRFGPGPGDGVRRAAPLRRRRDLRPVRLPMSIRPTWSPSWTDWTRPQRFSSSHRRRSRHWRR